MPHSAIVNGKYINIKKERAWGNYYNASPDQIMAQGYPAGGGGFSKYTATPHYQLGFPGVNTFNAINRLRVHKAGDVEFSTMDGYEDIKTDSPFFVLRKNPKYFHGTGTGRNLPDIAGNADIDTGYALYLTEPHGKRTKHFRKAWFLSGGTSFTAPQMAAANAVMNSGLGTSTGFWNPQIYKFAQDSDSPFTPLDSMTNNDNLYYAGQPGKLYNQATGLGTVNFEKLFESFNHKKS